MTSSSTRTGIAVTVRALRQLYRVEGEEVLALRDVDLDVAPGESLAVVGPSGSGKSTLLTALAGLQRPTAGVISFDGREVTGLSERELLRLRGTDVAMVAQGPARNLLSWATVADNVRFAQRGVPRAARVALPAPEDLMRSLGLHHLLRRRIDQLSGGEKQRLAVAVALATRPGLLLLDEPTSQLDHANRDRVLELVQTIGGEFGTTILAVTHDPDVAAALARSVTVRDGRLGPGVSATGRRAQPEPGRAATSVIWARGRHAAPEPEDDRAREHVIARTGPDAAPPVAADALPADAAQPDAIPADAIPTGRLDTIGLRDVDYARGGRQILARVSLTARAGEVLAVTGPSGSGKSTVLALLAGLDSPDYGELLVDGAARAPGTREGFGLILQGYGLIDMLTAQENVEVGLQTHGATRPEVLRRAREALDSVGMAGLGPHLIRELSGGQQQRVAIARALAIDPHVVLADEVTAELDAATQERALTLLWDHARRGSIVVIATHDPRIAARADREVRVEDGAIVIRR